MIRRVSEIYVSLLSHRTQTGQKQQAMWRYRGNECIVQVNLPKLESENEEMTTDEPDVERQIRQIDFSKLNRQHQNTVAKDAALKMEEDFQKDIEARKEVLNRVAPNLKAMEQYEEAKVLHSHLIVHDSGLQTLCICMWIILWSPIKGVRTLDCQLWTWFCTEEGASANHQVIWASQSHGCSSPVI